MSLYEKIKNQAERLSVIGLGYVGMPIAVAFAKKGIKVIGFDLNTAKVELYKKGIDPTKEVGDEAIKNSTVEFTSDEKRLQNAKFHIVAVPTPVNSDHTPDLSPVIGASEIVGRNLVKGSIVFMNPLCTQVLRKMFAYLFWRKNRDLNAVSILKLDIPPKELTRAIGCIDLRISVK